MLDTKMLQMFPEQATLLTLLNHKTSLMTSRQFSTNCPDNAPRDFKYGVQFQMNGR